jgi:hypothetical protein
MKAKIADRIVSGSCGLPGCFPLFSENLHQKALSSGHISVTGDFEMA